MTTPKPFCLANKESKLITKEDNVTTTHYVYYDGDIKQAVQELKAEWRTKCKKMEIMSGEVAIFELECLLKSKFGEALTK